MNAVDELVECFKCGDDITEYTQYDAKRYGDSSELGCDDCTVCCDHCGDIVFRADCDSMGLQPDDQFCEECRMEVGSYCEPCDDDYVGDDCPNEEREKQCGDCGSYYYPHLDDDDPHDCGSDDDDDDESEAEPYKAETECDCDAHRRLRAEKGNVEQMKYDAWQIVEAVVQTSPRVLLYGPPGTGKTWIATRTARSAYSITLTQDTPAAELRGHYVPVGGDFVWQDGPAIKAWKEGKRLVLNEIDLAGDDVMSFLHVILDDPEFARVTLPTGESVSPQRGFSVVATTNGKPADLTAALQDRFPVQVEILTPHPDAIKALPEDLREAAERTATASDPNQRIGIRLWAEYARLRNEIEPAMAMQAVFGKRAAAVQEALTASGIRR